MIGTINPDLEFLNAVAEADKLERERRYRELVTTAQEITPKLNWLTHDIERSWFEFSPADQAALVDLKRRLDRMRSPLAAPKNVIQSFVRALEAVRWLVYYREVLPFTIALASFMQAMDSVLITESKRRERVDAKLGKDRELQEIGRRQDEAVLSGHRTRYTQGEFQRHFKLS